MRTEKNIDDLFKLARNQKSLLSTDQIKDLIYNNVHQKHGYIKFNVKPRIGVYKMAIAFSPIIILAISAFFIFNVDNKSEPDNSSAKIAHQSTLANENYQENDLYPEKKEKRIIIYPKIKAESASNYISNDQSGNISDGIKFIELTENESEKLGIYTDEKTNNLSLYSNFYGNPTLVKVSSDWGASVKLVKNNNKFIPDVFPKLITDSYGFKRVAYSEDFDSTNNKTKPLRRSIKWFNRFLDAQDEYMKAMEQFFSIKIPNIKIQDYDTIIIPKMKLKVPKFNSFIWVDSLNNFDLKKFTDSLNLNIQRSMINIDSLLKNLPDIKMKIPKFNWKTLDSSYYQYPQFDWKYLDSLTKFKTDSTEFFEFELILPGFEWIDSISNNLKIERKYFKKRNKKNDIDLNELFNDNYLPDINKLIPFKVPNSQKGSGNFHFILWYEPTNELLNLLPDRIVNELKPELKQLIKTKNVCEGNTLPGEEKFLEVWRSCDGAIENMNLYPNPTSSKTTLNYILKEPRELHLSIYNLSGQKISDLRPSDTFEAGNYEEILDMGNYPPGLYLIILLSNKGEKAVQRILVE